MALRHAETQHHFAYEFRRWQLISNTPSEAFKGEWKLNGERIERCLRGQKWLSLGDMLRLEQIAGPILARLRFEPAPLTHPVLIEQFPRAPGVAEAESVH